MSSIPLFWLSLAFLGGIITASAVTLPLAVWFSLAAAAPFIYLATRRGFRHYANRLNQPSLSLPVVLQGMLAAVSHLWPAIFFLFFLGSARYASAQPPLTPAFITWYTDSPSSVTLTARLISSPERRDRYTNLRLAVQSICTEASPDCQEVRGGLLVMVAPNDHWRYGDLIQLKGKLETPPAADPAEPHGFSYRDYLARQGIYATMFMPQVRLLASSQGNPLLTAIYALKERSLTLIYRLWPDPEASLLAGILLGVESGIPAQVQQAFRDSGTAHIIAISGFNMSILAGLFTTLFGRLLGPRKGTLIAALGIAVYTVLVGASASVVRAAIMSGLSLFAHQIGRRQHGLNSLAFTAALMCLGNPYLLWDVSFQLSFAATLGLVLYAEPFSQVFIRLASQLIPRQTVDRLAGPIGEYLLFTLAAQMTTLPVILYHFQRLSLSSLLANPTILPAQPAVMILGGLAVLLGLLYFPLGLLVAPLAWPFVVYTVRLTEWFAALPGGTVVLDRSSLPVVIFYYVMLFSLTFAGGSLKTWLTTRWGGWRSTARAGGLFILIVLTVVAWQAALAAPIGYTELTLLDVGSGDAILLRSSSGKTVLIDGGPLLSSLSDALGRRLPAFQRHLDYLVIASTSAESLTALPRLVERFPPRAVLWAAPATDSRVARLLQAALTQAGSPITTALPGQTLDFGDGAKLHVTAIGQRGGVLLFEHGSFLALLPLGMDTNLSRLLQEERSLPPVTALLLANSGEASLNSPAWISHLTPRVILLSVAAGDRYGRPDAEILTALQGYTLLRTDVNGWIQLSTDGNQLWVETQKP